MVQIRTVTDGKSTWKEYEWPKSGLISWIEDEILFHPDTWYTKTLAILFDLLILFPLYIPLYQSALIYFASPWVGLDGGEWWHMAIKIIILILLWIPGICLTVWAMGCKVGENGIDADD